jgi:hypothetical protein
MHLRRLLMELEERLFVENEIIELTKELYSHEGCEVGGPLHIVLEDDNVESNHILWCLKYVGDHDYDEDFKILCYKIGALLFMLKEEDRVEIVRKAWFYAHTTSGL